MRPPYKCVRCGIPATDDADSIVQRGVKLTVVTPDEAQETAVEAIAVRLWQNSDERVSFNPWELVSEHYLAEAKQALAALLALDRETRALALLSEYEAMFSHWRITGIDDEGLPSLERA